MPYNDRLFQLLTELELPELLTIWQGALKRKPEDEEFSSLSHELQVAAVSAEWRAVHGHSVLNLARTPHELPWKRILIDVADKLKPGRGWTDLRMDDSASEPEIEAQILGFFDERFRSAWEAMSTPDRQKLADQLNAEIDTAGRLRTDLALRAGVAHVTTTSLSAALGAGLLSGTGALMLASGTTSAVVGGLMGGALYQLGIWLVFRLFGMLAGVQLMATGGAAAIGGALLSAPAAAAFLANALMSTSYRKTIPATLTLLCAHEFRRQFAATE